MANLWSTTICIIIVEFNMVLAPLYTYVVQYNYHLEMLVG